MQTKRMNGWMAVLAITLAGLLATGTQAADQWWDVGTASSVQGGNANWDTGTAAWAMGSGGTTTLAAWTNGNNAWFQNCSVSTATVNGATVNLLVLANASGAGNAVTLAPGAGSLVLTNGLTTYGSSTTPHAGQGGGGSAAIGCDVTLAADQAWHVANYNLSVTGRITGAYTLTKCGYGTTPFTCPSNSFAGLIVENGSINAYNGGTVLGGGALTIGAVCRPGESVQNFSLPWITLNPPTISGTALTTTAGTLTATGGGIIDMGSPAAGCTNVLSAGTLTRSGRGTLSFKAANQWGGRNQIYFSGGTTLVNGALPLWMNDVYNAGPEFLTYRPTGVGVITYSSSDSFNPANPAQMVSIAGGNYSLTASQTSYVVRVYYRNLNLNGKDLYLGDGASAGLSLANANITDGVGSAALDIGASELFVTPSTGSGGTIAVPMRGTGPLTIYGPGLGNGSSLILSNATLYAGGPITVWAPAGLTYVPPVDVTTTNSLFVGPRSSLSKSGNATVTLCGTNNFSAAASVNVNAGTLAFAQAVSTNNGTLNVNGAGGVGAIASLQNNAQFRGTPTVNVGGAAGYPGNQLLVTDATLGTAPNSSGWVIGSGAGSALNKLTALRASLASGSLTVGTTSANSNTVSVTGPNSTWDFNSGYIWVGFPSSTNNTLALDGGGFANGVVLTNIQYLYVGCTHYAAGGTTVSNTLSLSNGASLYVSGTTAFNVGVGGGNAIYTGNAAYLGGPGAKSTVSSTPAISVGGGGNTPLLCAGNQVVMTNVTVWSGKAGFAIAGSNNTIKVLAGADWTSAAWDPSTPFSGMNNTLLIDGGSLSHAQSLTVAGTYNTVRVTNGGVLEDNTLVVNAGAGNMITNSGGVYQFTTATPTITTNGALGGSIFIDSGTIAFRNVTSGLNLTNNTDATRLGRLTWSGNNALRLNNSIATNTCVGGYTFQTGNPVNYSRLEMINGTTKILGQGIAIGATGSVLFSNTVATIGGAFTCNGAMKVVDSQVTFGGNCTLQGGSITVSTNAASLTPITVSGALNTSGTISLDVSSLVAGKPVQLTLFTANGGLNDTATWNVTPAIYKVSTQGNTLGIVQLRGTVISFH